MAKQIFINLAVKDLSKSLAFYTALGFTNNPQFSDESGKCMAWGENIFVMILTHEKFRSFATKPIADTTSNVAALFSLSLESIDEVNNMMAKGLKAGGKEPTEMKDYGFMQQRTLKILMDTLGRFFLWILPSLHHNLKKLNSKNQISQKSIFYINQKSYRL